MRLRGHCHSRGCRGTDKKPGAHRPVHGKEAGPDEQAQARASSSSSRSMRCGHEENHCPRYVPPHETCLPLPRHSAASMAYGGALARLVALLHLLGSAPSFTCLSVVGVRDSCWRIAGGDGFCGWPTTLHLADQVCVLYVWLIKVIICLSNLTDQQDRLSAGASVGWLSCSPCLTTDENRPFWLRVHVAPRVWTPASLQSVAHVHMRHLSHCGLGAASAAFRPKSG